MVFITLKLIVLLKKFSEFSNLRVSVLFCLIVTKLYYELVNNHFCLVNYKLLCLFSNLSDAINVINVINVCCCCCLILPFAFARFLNIGISHQYNASFFTPLSYLLWRLSFHSYISLFFLKKT